MYICPYCFKKTVSVNGLKYHFRKVHNSMKYVNMKVYHIFKDNNKLNSDELLIAALSYTPKRVRSKDCRAWAYEIISKNCKED